MSGEMFKCSYCLEESNKRIVEDGNPYVVIWTLCDKCTAILDKYRIREVNNDV